MALADNLTEEKAKLTALLESEYSVYNLRDSPLLRLFIIRFLLGELVGSGSGGSGGDASAANQTSVQANAGSDASKVIAVQGVTGGKSIPVTINTNTAIALGAGTTDSKTTRVVLATDDYISTILGAPNYLVTTPLNTTILNSIHTIANPNSSTTVGVQVTGLTVSGATLTIEASNDNSNWILIDGYLEDGSSFNNFTTDRQFRIDASGRKIIRIRVSSVGTGTVVAYSVLTNAPNFITVTNKQLTTTNAISIASSTQLVDIGSTDAIATDGATLVGITAKVDGIGTNVVVRIEVSNVGGTDALDWDNASADGTDTTITANGTKSFKFDCAFAYVRGTVVSISSGTPTIDFITRLAQ